MVEHRAPSGQPPARELLEQTFRANATALRAFLQATLKSSADADDALQDVFIRVCQTPADVEIITPRAFLFKIARNLAIDMLRKRERESRHGIGTNAVDIHEFADLLSSDEPGADRILMSREIALRILDAIEQLSPKTKRVFLMHRFEELSHSEIAEELGVTTKAVEYHMTQALLKLRIARYLD